MRRMYKFGPSPSLADSRLQFYIFLARLEWRQLYLIINYGVCDMRVALLVWFVFLVLWGIFLLLQSDWNLSCDHGELYKYMWSLCGNNNNNNNNNIVTINTTVQ